MAQLLAVIINKKENPLKWTRRVDAVYVLGSMPISLGELRNDQGPNGCFKGMNMANAVFDAAESLADPAQFVPSASFKHARIARTMMHQKQWREVPCEGAAENSMIRDGGSRWFLHFNGMYVENVDRLQDCA